MFHRDEDLERIKTAFAAVGMDMKEFRRWQKQYEKVNKQWLSVHAAYQDARKVTGRVETLLKGLERMLTDGGGRIDRGAVVGILKELKAMQNTFDHEFIISREDVQFHSIYDTVLKLGTRALESESQRLILQSEVENLLDLLRENESRTAPDPRKLAFFYQYGTDKELSVLPPADRRSKVERIYEARFVKPIMGMLTEAVERADELAAELHGRDDRRSRKTFSAIEVLLEVRGAPKERARGLFEVLMS
jgi:hypothetical protein